MIYTIKDVAERTGMSPHTIRFYDKEGLLTFVKRSPSGIRLFSEDDFEPLYTIHCLKRSGMPLKKIKVFMELYLQGNKTIHERKEIFEQHRLDIMAKIDELQEMLDIINYKCWYFGEAEKYGDIYYYKNLPENEVPQQITDFYKKVKEFHTP